jgi:hypothetical protein
VLVRDERVGEVSRVLMRDREVVEKLKGSEDRVNPEEEVSKTWQEWFKP